ncbi:MLO-like protein 3 isoform X2 [Rhododendron vialii]|nr:MLO-like protein 3 isoform X2 [Rhododendron vialii]
MLPCRKQAETPATTVENVEHLVVGLARTFLPTGEIYNRTIWKVPHRRLDDDDGQAADDGGGATTGSCGEGKASLVSEEGLHQLHIFIFVLAVMQIVYSVLTMGLGRAKMRSWKAWEEETQTTEYQVENDPNRFRFTRQTTFGRRHMTHCTDSSLHLWIKCFFRQFFHSVAKVDYLTLRHGFIAAHLSARHNNFNFQKYIQRSLEEDFKVVVSISPFMWFLVVILMLVDVRGWNVFLWLSYAPLLVVLVLGTKLQVVVARMALQLQNQNSVIIGAPVVQPHDDLFWFGRPMFVLTLLHLTLFVNAFELAFFIWVTIQFGFNSCYHEHTAIIITRIVLAVSVQVLCSYITLPLYALVTQMGSQFKSKVLEEQTSRILKQWHAEVRRKRRQQERQYSFVSPRTSLSTDWSLRNSPIDFSSHRRPLAMPTDQSTSNRGEITEE